VHAQLHHRDPSGSRAAGARERAKHRIRPDSKRDSDPVTLCPALTAAGVPIRTLQEWMGHRDYKTTLIYADYAPAANEAALVNAAFATDLSINLSINLRETGSNSNQENAGNHD
jgi:integrase